MDSSICWLRSPARNLAPELPLQAAPCKLSLDVVSADFVPIFEQEYRALRPRAPMPPIMVRFRRFTSLNTTIRLREGQIHVSLSDLLEGAPENVIRAIAHILLAKLYKKPIDATQNLRYRRFASSAAVTRQTELIRHARGSKRSLLRGVRRALWRVARPPRAHMKRASRQALARPLRRRAQHHCGQPRL